MTERAKISGYVTITGEPESRLKHIRPCTKCSCSGIYLDYAGPGIHGGITTSCKECKGKGWIYEYWDDPVVGSTE